MPIAGGKWKNWWKETAVAIVNKNRNIIATAPNFNLTLPTLTLGLTLGTNKVIKKAGIK